jgi:hypothetical protein
MTIAAELEQLYSIQSTLIDLPLENEADDEIEAFVGELDVSKAQFVGLSTMCNTFPRTLSVARAIKNRYPDLPIVSGGPQATTNAGAILHHYPFIDCVVVGEAEMVLEGLVRGFATRHPTTQPGLDCSPLERALFQDAIEFDFWKYHTCRDVSEPPLHLSGVDFLAADSMSFSGIVGGFAANNRFVYSVAPSDGSIRCLRVSGELCSLLSVATEGRDAATDMAPA